MESETDFLMYQTEDGETKISVRLEDETVWMTQKAISELFQKNIKTINEHIKKLCGAGVKGVLNYPEKPDSSNRGNS